MGLGHRFARAGLVAGASLALVAAATPRATMHRIFDRFAELLPLVLDDEHFLDETSQARIGTLLGELDDVSEALEAHAAQRDADFQYHAGGLSNDLREARRRFDRGAPEEARFFVVTATQYCVACHSRVPKARNFPLASRLTHEAAIQSLDGDERALFHVATRSFGTALDEFEGFLLDPGTDPRRISIGDTIYHYLTIAIRVERDPARAARTLAQLAERSDLGDEFQQVVAAWRADLATYGPSVATPPSLARARELASAGEAEGAAARTGLVRDLVASSDLLQIIDRDAAPADERAEAYYWLGVIGDRHAFAFWHPETATHLERAVRLAPGGPHAQDALARLEEHWRFVYGGSGGLHLPREANATLEELRHLVAEAKASAAPPAPGAAREADEAD
ncbi:MAG: hypothetical protein KC560_02535 [Myxococcales bacterium]|nr:hypothetical protein [Myxococcales bacterium]